MRKCVVTLLSLAVMAAVSSAAEREVSAFDARHNAILSRLQSMGHGVYSEREWAEVEESVNELVADAARRNDGEAIIRAALIKAMVLGDMRRLNEEAVQVLRQARDTVASMDGVDASRLFVKEAVIQANAGNAPAVQRIINEYKISPYYDPRPYAWSGGSGPGDPLVLVRPSTTDTDSLPLTVMEAALTRASSAPGLPFPDAVLTDLHGRQFSLSALRGKVVLVDFFARGWRSWEDDRAAQADLWQRYHGHGFEMVSINLEMPRVKARHPQGLDALGLPGLVVPEAPDLTRQLGIFGDRTTYLLDAQGNVIARNLRGQDLVFAVRRALGR